jgi:hypothetical protein
MSNSVTLITEVTPLICNNQQQQQQQQIVLFTSRKSVYIYAIIAAVGGFVCGYDTGSISSVIALPIFQKRFFIHGSLEYYESILLASYLVTSMLGAFFSGYFCGNYSLIRYFLITELLTEIPSL